MSSGDKDTSAAGRREIKKITTTVIRVASGILFVFSSLVKLNDPLGLAFKMEEYLSPQALNMPFFIPMAESLSIAIIALELILGLSLLLGRFKIFTLWTLFILNAGFMLLTLYSAVTGAVSDCGCFGDAMPMDPWSSFAKNVIICILIAVLLVWQRFIKPIAGFRTSMSVVAVAFAFVYGMSYYVLHNEPIVDFRPYKVGVNIKEAMTIPEDAALPVYENEWEYMVNGEVRKYTDADEPWNIRDAEFISRRSVLVKEGFRPQIENFIITDVYGGDVTEGILGEEDVHIVLCYDFDNVDEDEWTVLKEWLDRQTSLVYLVSNSSSDRFADKGINATILYADPVMIKTIMRSSLGVMHLQNGTIVSKTPLK